MSTRFKKPEISKDEAMKLWILERSDYAKEQVTLNNLGLIGFVLKSLKLSIFDEDLFSIGLIGLVKAVNTFNPDKGVKFATYARTVIRNEILQTHCKKIIIPILSIDEPCTLRNGQFVDFSEMIADSKNYEEETISNIQKDQIFSILNEREKKIVILRMDGKKQNEIAKICGISQSQVSKIIKSAYKKCKKILDIGE